jgi:hypothetical protein
MTLFLGRISMVTSFLATAELKLEMSLRSNPIMARYKASVMASRGLRLVREVGCAVLERLGDGAREVLLQGSGTDCAALCLILRLYVVDDKDVYTKR